MANNQLPDVGQVVHTVPLLNKDLFGVPEREQHGSKQDLSPQKLVRYVALAPK